MIRHLSAVLLMACLICPGALSMTFEEPWTKLRPESWLSRHRADEVTQVPGFEGRLPSRHFGGYITVDEVCASVKTF